jgi:hypothetical protein
MILSVFLQDESEIEKAIKIIQTFGKYSGLELNKSKTKLLVLGKNKARYNTKINDVEVVQNIKCLGIYIGHNKVFCEEKNWNDRILNMQQILNLWKKRDLTLLGKVSIMKSLAIPKILYAVTCTVTPDWVPSYVNKILFNFLWSGNDKIKRDTVIGNIDRGGLGMIDFKIFANAIKASWIDRILNPLSIGWNFFVKNYLCRIGLEKVLEKVNCNTLFKHNLLKSIPKFYLQIIESFQETNQEILLNSFDELCLWGNKQLKNKEGKSLFFPEWIKSGILFVKDLPLINYKIDITNLCGKVENKSNIFCEIIQMNFALKNCKYQKLVGTGNLPIPHQNPKKSKEYYNTLLEKKFKEPYSHGTWKDIFKNSDASFDIVYKIKVRSIQERKVSEFNFKCLHRILSCGQNLW